MAQIYYSGPNRQPVIVNETDIPALVQNGTVTPATLVWMDGMADWKPLRDVRPDLATGVPAAGVSGVPAMPPPQRKSHEIDYLLIGEEMQIVEI